jgi:hypothetical protein
MRSLPLILLVVLLIGLWLIVRRETEGFTGDSALQAGIQDRMNPLASQQNPLTNPAAPIGLPEAQANTLRGMMETALNIPTMVANGLGSFQFEEPQNPNTPRIDTDASFLGMVKFCKDTGKTANPFGDPKFAANCGMCLSSGSLITGEKFTTPTGVLVYDTDKQAALTKQVSAKLPFPLVVPSLQSATCVGASVRENAEPVLAITEKDYNRFKNRIRCTTGQSFGDGCAMCTSTKNYTYVAPDDGLQPVNIVLFGLGKATLRLSGTQVGTPVLLSESNPSVIPLGRVKEGSQLQIEVNADALPPPTAPAAGATPQEIAAAATAAAQRVNPVLVGGGPYLYGFQQSLTPKEKPHKLALEKFLEKDALTGSTPRKLTTKYFAAPTNLFLAKIVPKPNSDRMVLEGVLPLTFVESDSMATYDCPTSPFVSTQEHAEMLIDDPCIIPKGQSPGNYSEGCMRQKLSDAGCTSAGTWYSNPPAQAELLKILPTVQQTVKTNPQHAMGCLGRQITTPCDAYIGNGQVPNQACLAYLYQNGGENSARVGRTYNTAPNQYTSFSQATRSVQFCQPTGNLNPMNAEGMSELTNAARGYKGSQGIEAVKLYLSDVFTKAVGNLDINKIDAEGGRQTSWQKCFGIPIADATVPFVRSQPVVEQCVANIPRSFTPRFKTFQTNIVINKDYSLSFTITPYGTRPNWAQIFRFGTMTGDCCVFGQRTPALWFFPSSTALHMRIGDSRDGNFGIDTTPLPINQKANVRLHCEGNFCTLTVNDKVFSAQQPTFRYSGQVQMWITDGIYGNVGNCLVENFCLTNL